MFKKSEIATLINELDKRIPIHNVTEFTCYHFPLSFIGGAYQRGFQLKEANNTFIFFIGFTSNQSCPHTVAFGKQEGNQFLIYGECFSPSKRFAYVIQDKETRYSHTYKKETELLPDDLKSFEAGILSFYAFKALVQ